MRKKRSPIEVFNDVRATFPEEILQEHQGALDSVGQSIEYASPENMGFHIERFYELLGEIIGSGPLREDDPDWKFNAVSALMNRPVEKLKEEVNSC